MKRTSGLNVSNEESILNHDSEDFDGKYLSNNNSEENVEDSNSQDKETSKQTNTKYNCLNFTLSNARSLAGKVDSLIDMFSEADIHFAMITETWFKNDIETVQELEEIKHSEGLEFIWRNRKTRGGGVAIAFKNSKATFRRLPITNNKFEVVGAIGKTNKDSRQIAVFAIYIPPKQTVSKTVAMYECLADSIEKVKQKYADPYIIIGGDVNRRDITPAIADFPDIEIEKTGPTRGTVVLDVVATNLRSQAPNDTIETDLETTTFFPLESINGDRTSDHKTVVCRARIPHIHCYETISYYTRSYTTKAEEEFGRKLVLTDWELIQCSNPSDSACALNEYLGTLVDEFFPLRLVKQRSCDPPWISKSIRRLIRKRKRLYKKHGRNKKWKIVSEECQRRIRESKIAYLEKIKQKVRDLGNVRFFYDTIKVIDGEDRIERWCIQKMFPSKSDQDIAEMAAVFFNTISQDFVPLEKFSSIDRGSARCPEPFEISARIKRMKKTKSTVNGDIDYRLTSRYCDILAIPLHYIFNQVYTQLQWPSLWSTETVTLIPKVNNPDSLSQLRNFSCTPFFSKVLESFILEELKKNVSLSKDQFGGQKGVGVDHFLIETWNEILSALEDPRASSSLMAIDFQKAFNRMCHHQCLTALRNLGAQEIHIELVKAFLTGRTMQVKVGNVLSLPKTVPGGSPQGSILGNFLFCCTTDEFSRMTDSGSSAQANSPSTVDFEKNGISGSDISDSDNVQGYPSPIRRPVLLDLSNNDQVLDDDSFRYFKTRKKCHLMTLSNCHSEQLKMTLTTSLESKITGKTVS